MKDVAGNNADWRWTRDGASLTYDNWHTNEPNSRLEQCAVVVSSDPFNGDWVDVDCPRTLSALCESDRVSQTIFLNLLTTITKSQNPLNLLFCHI